MAAIDEGKRSLFGSHPPDGVLQVLYVFALKALYGALVVLWEARESGSIYRHV